MIGHVKLKSSFKVKHKTLSR